MQKAGSGKAWRSTSNISPAIEGKRYLKKVRRTGLPFSLHCPSLTSTLPVRQKLNIINDHITDDKEEFDLNLFPTVFGRSATAGSDPPSAEPSKTNLSLSRAPTKNSIVDTIWSRKQSNANMDIGSGMSRVSTLRSERSDSVVGGAIEEGELLNVCVWWWRAHANTIRRARTLERRSK